MPKARRLRRSAAIAEPIATAVALQRNLIYKLSGAIRQIDHRGVVPRPAASCELDALVVNAVCLCHGGDLLAGSGKAADARVEGRKMLLQVPRSVPLRAF
jgi:hypothetical protein